MKVIYEEDYAPFINYTDAYVYLDTRKEELRITTYYTFNVHDRIDFAWIIPTRFDRNAYNDLLDEIKPLAIELLKHHTIDGGRGYLDEDGEDIKDEIGRLIHEWMEDEERFVYFVEADRMDVDSYYSPWYVSPPELREIARGKTDPNGDFVLYFVDDYAEHYEIASMEVIGDSIEDMTVEQASKYLSRIYSVYEKDGFASDFEDVLLPFLEEEGYIEYVDGDWYLADTEDKIEWN